MKRIALTFRCDAPGRGNFRAFASYPEDAPTDVIERQVAGTVDEILTRRCPVTGRSFAREDVTREEWTTPDL